MYLNLLVGERRRIWKNKNKSDLERQKYTETSNWLW